MREKKKSDAYTGSRCDKVSFAVFSFYYSVCTLKFTWLFIKSFWLALLLASVLTVPSWQHVEKWTPFLYDSFGWVIHLKSSLVFREADIMLRCLLFRNTQTLESGKNVLPGEDGAPGYCYLCSGSPRWEEIQSLMLPGWKLAKKKFGSRFIFTWLVSGRESLADQSFGACDWHLGRMHLRLFLVTGSNSNCQIFTRDFANPCLSLFSLGLG